MNSCVNCKFYNGKTPRGEFRCYWLYKNRDKIKLPPYLRIANKGMFTDTNDCYPKFLRKDLGNICLVFENKEKGFFHKE